MQFQKIQFFQFIYASVHNNILSKEDINESINNSTKNEINELTFINIDQEKNMVIPIIPEKIISNINIKTLTKKNKVSFK